MSWVKGESARIASNLYLTTITVLSPPIDDRGVEIFSSKCPTDEIKTFSCNSTGTFNDLDGYRGS